MSFTRYYSACELEYLMDLPIGTITRLFRLGRTPESAAYSEKRGLLWTDKHIPEFLRNLDDMDIPLSGETWADRLNTYRDPPPAKIRQSDIESRWKNVAEADKEMFRRWWKAQELKGERG